MSRIIGTGRYRTETYPGGAAAGGTGAKVRVNASDTTADFLEEKAIPGSNITITPVDLGDGYLALSFAASVPPGSSDHKVLVDGADTTAGFLAAKIAAGAAIALSVLSPGGNEQVSFAVSDLRNAQVASDAAIAGTKIDPNFGSQNVQTTGTLSAGATEVTTLTISSLGAGVGHLNAGGVLSSSLIVNADVAAGAAIAGTKIDPNFGAQNISTTGTLSAGATTVTGLTVSAFVTGVVHSDGAGVLSSSLIVNADVSAAAAISGTKINPNFGSQNVSTTGTLSAGSTTVTDLTDSSLGVGVVHSDVNGLFSSSLIVNADVAAAAAIAGTKISPDFGAQNVQTTGAYIGNSSSSFIRLGLAPGSGSSGAAAASTGYVRGARGAPGFSIYARNDADTADIRIMEWDSTGPILAIGQATALSVIQVSAAANVDTLIAGTRRLRIQASGVVAGGSSAFAISFAAAVTTPIINQAESTTAGGTGQLLTLSAQVATGTGTVTAGALRVQGGKAGQAGFPNTNGTGGKLELLGGDAEFGSGSNTGAHALFRAGRGLTAVSAVDGNIAIHDDPTGGTPWQSMQRGLFLGNAVAAPAGNPTGGGFFYVIAGALFYRGSGGAVTPIAPA